MQLQFITPQEGLQQAISAALTEFAKQIPHPYQPVTDPVEINGTKELCARLDITEPTVIRWRKKGKIPFLLIGSSVRYNYRAVIKALEVNANGKGTKSC